MKWFFTFEIITKTHNVNAQEVLDIKGIRVRNWKNDSKLAMIFNDRIINKINDCSGKYVSFRTGFFKIDDIVGINLCTVASLKDTILFNKDKRNDVVGRDKDINYMG